VTIAVLMLGSLLFAMTQTMVVPLLPTMASDIGVDLGAAAWLVTAPLATGAALTPILGRVADQFGKKSILIGILAAMTVGSVVMAFSTFFPVMIGARCLQGTCLAFVPVAISLLRDLVHPAQFARGVGILSASVGFGTALAVPMAAILGSLLDWHLAFLIVGIGDVLAIVLTVWLVSDGRTPAGGRFDVWGGVGLAVAMTALTVLISEAPRWGLQPITIVLTATFVVVIACWAWWERRVRDPIVDLGLALRGPVALTNLLAALLGFSLFANLITSTQLAQLPTSTGHGFGLNLLEAGWLILPSGLIMIVLAPAAGALCARIGAKAVMILAAAVLTLGYVAHLTVPGLIGLGASMITVSIGVSIAYAALPILVSSEVPAAATASANGINVLARMIGQALCSSVVAALLSAFVITVDGVVWPAREAFQWSYAAALAASVLALIVALLLPRRPRSGTHGLHQQSK
jgi:MFS family permease